MNTLWAIFIVIHTASIIFGGISLMRLYAYIRRYRFDESKYTLLLGFIHLHWIATAYIALIALWVPMSFFIFTRL